MEKEKVVFFLDYANINRAAREKRLRLDYHDLLQYVGEERFLVDAHCYVPINPRNEHRLDAVIEDLWRSGYIVTTRLGAIAGGTYKCNFDVEIAMDILKAIYQVKPDIIVLASGDADFVPLIQEVRRLGGRVEVAAFEETAGSDILLKCSGFNPGSWQLAPIQYAGDRRKGDNLWTYFTLISEVLSGAED